MPLDDKNNPAKSFGQGYEYVAVGFTFAFAILLFGAVGWVVDGWLHTRPLVFLVGAFLGGFAGFMHIYYRVKRDTEAGKRPGGSGKGSA
ncbi:MAG: AtpZ/AtpI family protein [Gemmatimonadales bacterium]